MRKIDSKDVSICINCYKIRFNEKNKSTTRTLKEVFNGLDFTSIAKKFMKHVDTKDAYVNDDKSRILYIEKTLKLLNGTWAGIIMKGHNGPQTDIDELVKGSVKKVGKVSKDQYHCLPYFFLLYWNKEKPDSLTFLAQSYRQYGFKDVFEEAFRAFVTSYSLDSNVKFNPLSVGSLFEKYIREGDVKKIRLVKHGLSKSAEKIVEGDKGKDSDYTMELSVKSSKGFMGIKDKITYDDASFIEQVQIEGFEYEEAYADVIVAGRKRILSITKPSEFIASYDLTENVKIYEMTRLPDFNDVMREAMVILENDLKDYV